LLSHSFKLLIKFRTKEDEAARNEEKYITKSVIICSVPLVLRLKKIDGSRYVARGNKKLTHNLTRKSHLEGAKVK